jgi:hypothetical protein
MAQRAAACLLACCLAGLPVPASADATAEAACAAERDRALDTLDGAQMSVTVAFDADIAVADSPEFQLLKERDALLGEIAEERQAVWARYRRCVAGPQPR